MDERFLKPYDPSTTEDRIYKQWLESNFFNPDTCVEKGVTTADAEAFSIVLPPPNVTGMLHLGHAFEDSLQDVAVRYHRMCGKRALWVPGTDSAAIATQARVEKNIYKEEKKTRHDLGRAELVHRVEHFAKESEDTILSQVKKLGASLDWSRYAYTLDEARTRAVTEAFVRMFDAGLIYRGHRIVNWDPKGQTTISDDEIVYKDETTKFYYLKYGPFTIGTARPETKFGDKYVVMHPNDPRYAQYTPGQQIELEWINGPITTTIIKDEAIDMEFGTGVMTITPWHSQVDFEIAERHELDREQIIDQYGKLLPIAGEFAGMKIAEAREKIVEKLQAKGLVEKIDDKYEHAVATADRTGAIIEPQIMEQWFVAVDKPFTLPHSEIDGIKNGQTLTLKELMMHAVKSGQIVITPEQFEKRYYHWIENLHDWNISRQIWFGHRIPVWYRGEEIFVGTESPEGDGWEQDPDVLDTWFSSALWTFSTLGWPEKTADLKNYHPTTLMAPGYEILFLWVSRMILMSGFHLGQIPFKTALIHGIVRDSTGQKFSKSAGNGIDPIEVIDEYGADALRMALLVGVAPGNDSRFEMEKVRAYKKFANKLWNVARFVLINTENMPSKQPKLLENDSVRMNELSKLAEEVTGDIENFRYHLAAEKLYHYVWHILADDVLEERKEALAEGPDADARASAQWTLLTILKDSLKMLHPFMPFITEEIWTHLPNRDSELLMVAKWPR